MSNYTVNKLAYLLGVPEPMISSQLSPDQKIEDFSYIGEAPRIRACCRARQVALFHFTGGKKIFSLPDSLRSYCQDGIFDELQQEFQDAGGSWTFANRMTDSIVGSVKETMEAMDIPHADILLELIFRWPSQNKATFMTLSQQYHNRRFSFPYSTFIPKPKSFEQNLRYLLTSDEVLFSASPIALAISAQAGGAKAEPQPAPEALDFPNATYISTPFSTALIPYREGTCVSYIDYDNIPPFIAAQICRTATYSHPVKMFYDDRARGDINTLMGFPFVEFCFVERLKAEKSLVDSRILTAVVQDCYTDHPSQAILYSSDSDFFVLAPILAGEGVAFTVVTQEENVSPAYVEKLGGHNAECCILSKAAAVPSPDPELIKNLLRHQLLHTTLGECKIQEITKEVLHGFADEKYHSLLQKTTEAEIEKLLKGAKLVVKNGGVALEL